MDYQAPEMRSWRCYDVHEIFEESFEGFRDTRFLIEGIPLRIPEDGLAVINGIYEQLRFAAERRIQARWVDSDANAQLTHRGRLVAVLPEQVQRLRVAAHTAAAARSPAPRDSRGVGKLFPFTFRTVSWGYTKCAGRLRVSPDVCLRS